jgi:hypothetical protein
VPEDSVLEGLRGCANCPDLPQLWYREAPNALTARDLWTRELVDEPAGVTIPQKSHGAST